jgi:[ribosomal protein S18]-alanine N-acetyltransferase
MPISFKPMTTEAARSILSWRYGEPYELYNADPANLIDDLAALTDPAYRYYAIYGEDGSLVAFCCFGEDAQVRGGDYAAPALDVGVGMRPDLTGRGQGAALIRDVLVWGQQAFGPTAFRCTVAAFNKRAQKACRQNGFRKSATFRRPSDKQQFLIFTRAKK